MQQGDAAWLVILVGVIVFELTADDLLSESADRSRARHLWLTRLLVAAIAGHLAGVTPPALDIFSARNVIHRWIVEHYPLARRDRLKPHDRAQLLFSVPHDAEGDVQS